MLVLFLLTSGANCIAKAGLIIEFHLLNIKMAWGFVNIVFGLSKSQILKDICSFLEERECILGILELPYRN